MSLRGFIRYHTKKQFILTRNYHLSIPCPAFQYQKDLKYVLVYTLIFQF